ncbi:hypothetical protein INR49_012012 [Caranx melampygus]|nr:hypothetical protein INR49_012012 [Caranx melampygus]
MQRDQNVKLKTSFGEWQPVDSKGGKLRRKKEDKESGDFSLFYLDARGETGESTELDTTLGASGTG